MRKVKTLARQLRVEHSFMMLFTAYVLRDFADHLEERWGDPS